MISVHSAHMSTHHDLDQWNLNQDKRLCQRVCGKFGLIFPWNGTLASSQSTLRSRRLGLLGSMFYRLKPRIGYSSSITKIWKCSGSFGVRKTDVWVCSLSNLVNLVNALLGSKFDVWWLEAKNTGVRVRSPIDEHIRVLSMFEKWCSSSLNVR